jgi:CheY-like chemotaxis protein/HPt (histidine-containing phosphotransfer) domain-containing protein
VDSRQGAGSRFTFTARLTLARPAAAEADPVRPTSPPTHPLDRGRVLVVEDNDINQLVALGILEALGYSGEVAHNGQEAVAKVGQQRCDAVLMDLQMPVMDGFTAARRIRAEEGGGARVPIIAMTASAITGERERCLAAGMDDFLTKPVHSDQLASALHSQLRAGAARRPCPEPAAGPPRAVPTTAAAVAPDLDPGRLDELLAMGERAVPLVDRAISNFVTGFGTTLEELGTAARAGDAATLRAVAHRLKGSAMNLGAARVAEVAQHLESLGDQDSTSGATPALDRLRQAGAGATEALSAYRAARLPG